MKMVSNKETQNLNKEFVDVGNLNNVIVYCRNILNKWSLVRFCCEALFPMVMVMYLSRF